MRLLHRLLALALFGTGVVAASGCLSPTLPLPPPEAPDLIHEETTGSWLVAGSCVDHSLIVVFNSTRGEGVARTCTQGSYAATIQGERCDVGFISQEIHDETSEIDFQLEEVSNGEQAGPICK